MIYWPWHRYECDNLNPVLGLTNLETKQELDLATVPAKNLYKRSQTFDNFEQKINLIHKDFLKIVSEF